MSTRPGAASRRLGPLRVAAVIALAMVTSLLVPATTTHPATAAPPPSPLLWERTYVDPTPLSPQDQLAAIWGACADADILGFRENASAGPRIGVLGDSTINMAGTAALADPAVHWMWGAHCGESFETAIDGGRVATVLGASPDVVVVDLGYNNLTDFFVFQPHLLPSAISGFGHFLDVTDAAPCRVVHTIPPTSPDNWPAADRALFAETAGWLNLSMALEAQAHPNVHVTDWASRVNADHSLVSDGQHLTPAGINAQLNVTLEAARSCWAPDSPVGLTGVPGAGSATLWWDPLPAAEGVTDHTVELSDGRFVQSGASILNVGGLTDGVPVRFRVSATNPAGTGEPSAWSDWIVPGVDGVRFGAVDPLRVLDTRDGTGGRLGALGPGETIELDLSGSVPAGTSAVVLNLTATGQTAPTFVTAWPGDRPKPLASNLNPRPGIAAVPAMATVPLSPAGTVKLYNNTGWVHLIADLVGTYGAPGDPSGSLYAGSAPLRLLDTRDPGGVSPGAFGSAETRTLSLAGAGVPGDATAVVLNVTSTDTTAPSFVTLWPTGAPRPVASNLNPQPGLTRANLTTVKVGAGTAVSIFNNSAATELIVDLLGYYGPAGALGGGAEFFPVTPERHLDTRFGTGGVVGPVGNAGPTAVGIAGSGSVPVTGVSAVDANLTVVAPVSPGHSTAWPSGPMPVASNLNYESGEVVANRALATTDAGGLLLWSATPSIHYVVDLNGWFGPIL